MKTVRRRFWIESGLAFASGTLTALTLVSRDWIEAVAHVDPDHRGGWLEWLIALTLSVCCAVITGAARSEWRRRSPAPASSG